MKWFELAKLLIPIIGLAIPKVGKFTGIISDAIEEAERLEKKTDRTDKAGNVIMEPVDGDAKRIYVDRRVRELAAEHGFDADAASEAAKAVFTAANGLHTAKQQHVWPKP